MVSRLGAASPITGLSKSKVAEASAGIMSDDDRFAHTFVVPLDKIQPDPGQPRGHFDEGDLKDLSASMDELGLLQPIVVRKDPNPEQRRSYIIVYGERRWRAAKMLGWKDIQVSESTGSHEEKALVENMQRVGRNPIEEARGIQRLIQARGFTHERCAQALGLTRISVTEVLHILVLPEDFLEKVANGEANVSRSILIELARLPDGDVRSRLLEMALSGELTVKMLRQARNSSNRPKPQRSPKERPPGFEAGSLERLLTGVQSVRSGAYKITAPEKERLQKIREEIDFILGDD
jgi:ParB family transcriptional regulator, chromosome partitioning protein